MRLINADKVILEIVHKYGREQGDAILEIDNAPVVDAVPVVRCKDCKYWRDFGNGYHFCDIFDIVESYDSVSYDSNPDDYCSRGEKSYKLYEI